MAGMVFSEDLATHTLHFTSRQSQICKNLRWNGIYTEGKPQVQSICMVVPGVVTGVGSTGTGVGNAVVGIGGAGVGDAEVGTGG
eukprot:CAMPEP_0113948390 /NCGR_PEP_ID=MMETSP1339-20121228/70104_1 /TAXON_ID=94617 /ORGANISM="Fibrocapsa japonica" /LENGTH=83 /DNA_ID=CAMNT_0000955437 /DNA_START=88 /DNA_END=336 /DNA_ORIENTATION=+ /assembly_acc=CAM_ASM_000762